MSGDEGSSDDGGIVRRSPRVRMNRANRERRRQGERQSSPHTRSQRYGRRLGGDYIDDSDDQQVRSEKISTKKVKREEKPIFSPATTQHTYIHVA